MSAWCDYDVADTRPDACVWYRPGSFRYNLIRRHDTLIISNQPEYNDSLFDCFSSCTPERCPHIPGMSAWRVTIAGSGTRCDLQVGPLTSADTGAFSCSLVTINATKKAVIIRQDLETPELEFDPGPDITVTEGDLVRWTCEATVKVNNVPTMYWRLGPSSLPGNCTVTKLGEEDGVASWRMTNVLDYTAMAVDSKQGLRCLASIKDDLNNSVIVNSDIYYGMTILPRPGPQPKPRHGLKDWEIALIVIGVLLFVFIIVGLILCFCFGLFCFAGQRKKSGKVDKKQSTIVRPGPVQVSSVRQSKVRPIVQYVDIDDLDSNHSSSKITGNKKRGHHQPQPSLDAQDDKNYSQDSPTMFHYEGGDSSSGSLSSIVSSEVSDEDEPHISTKLARLGDKFSGLAKLYTEDTEDVMDTESDTSSDRTVVAREDVPVIGFESWV